VTRILATIMAILVFAPCCWAGDYGDREIIGFSPDGAYFAFEEYGVQDGSGFPYSNIFIIDTAKDDWLAGTPIRRRVDDEMAPLSRARAESRAKALPLLAKHGIAPRGVLAVSNPATELSANPYKVRFRLNPFFNMAERAWTLDLEPLPFPPTAACENFGTTQGLKLTITDPDGKQRVLSEDKSVPDSRFCPRGYAISDVVTFTPEGGETTLAVLLSLFRQGFEGTDRRFLAVTTRVEDPSK
jgi:predicted secreted protein